MPLLGIVKEENGLAIETAPLKTRQHAAFMHDCAATLLHISSPAYSLCYAFKRALISMNFYVTILEETREVQR